MSRPADGGECLAERRIRDRQRVLAGHWERARREYPESLRWRWGAEQLHKYRDHFVRDRFKPGPKRCYWLEPNPRRSVKAMTLAERRARDAALEECQQAGVRCKVSRFRG